MADQDDLFHPVIELPDDIRSQRYDRLVGLDDVKIRLRKEATVLTAPERLGEWAKKHHGRPLPALELLSDRAPLIVFGGDVGTGKTALAESFGCDLAAKLRVPVMLYRLKLTTRGSGLVGEMTTLISDAFSILQTEGRKAKGKNGAKSVLVLVVDEADAVAQSREATQMHHEDRAGVDAFLEGVDSLAGEQLPVLVVLCTNRLGALDPALRRRAAATFTFGRPDAAQRRTVLDAALEGLGLKSATVEQLVKLTGTRDGRPEHTYSDLTQRLVPSIVLAAFPDGPVTDEIALSVAENTPATPQFAEQAPTTVGADR
jgi:AAA+ superfamily predicted ATPase